LIAIFPLKTKKSLSEKSGEAYSTLQEPKIGLQKLENAAIVQQN